MSNEDETVVDQVEAQVEAQVSDGPEEPVDATPEEKLDAAARAQSCAADLQMLLRRWNCRIVATINPPEPVGWAGDRVQISAGYGIVPNPDPQP